MDNHLFLLHTKARTNWWFDIVDEFVVKQLPTIVTWILSLV